MVACNRPWGAPAPSLGLSACPLMPWLLARRSPVSSNGVGDEGTCALAKWLETNTTLTSLSLGYWARGGHARVRAVREASPTTVTALLTLRAHAAHDPSRTARLPAPTA